MRIKTITKVTSIITASFFSFISNVQAQNFDAVQLGSTFKNPSSFIELNNKLIFKGFSQATGSEIFYIDKKSSEPKLLKDIATGSSSSVIDNFAVVGNKLYFSASTAATGAELWVTDGTTEGTMLVKDIYAGSTGSSISKGVAFNNKYYFRATDADNGSELWVSDGTELGTSLLKDIYKGAGNSYPYNFNVFNGNIYFSANDSTNGTELWKSDGTTDGTELVLDIWSGSGNSNPTKFIEYDGYLYFNASNGNTNGKSGNELWRTDGTTNGTALFKDFWTGVNGGAPTNIFIFNNKLYFDAHTSSSGREIWYSDGTLNGTNLLIDINSGSASTSFYSIYSSLGIIFYVSGNKFYFVPQTTAEGAEPWVSDGTAEGTHILKDINPGTGNSYLTNASFIDNKIYFVSNDGTNGSELWSTDGTSENTVLVKDINLGSNGSNISASIAFNNNLYFAASNGSGTYLYIHGSKAPVISVKGNSHKIIHNSTTTADTNNTKFDKVCKGKFVENTFMIYNNGTDTLFLNEPIQINVNSQFKVSVPPASFIAPKDSSEFSIKLSSLAVGLTTMDVKIPSNDYNTMPFKFSVSGTVVPNETYSNVTVNTCKSYTWGLNNITYNLSGTYNDTIPNSLGCDSIITLNLTIPNLLLTVSNNNNTLTANESNANEYQWINCSDKTIIPSATNQSFTPTTNGEYAVIITKENCKDTTSCVLVDLTTGIINESNTLYSIFPNPANQNINIVFSNNYIGKLEVLDLNGILVKSVEINNDNYSIDITDFKNGIYTLKAGTTFSKFSVVK